MKRRLIKKYFCLITVLLLLLSPVSALELDTSVDDEIRRTYDPSKLEQTLPELPKTAPSQTTAPAKSQVPQTPPKTLPVTPDAKPQIGVKKFQTDYK